MALFTETKKIHLLIRAWFKYILLYDAFFPSVFSSYEEIEASLHVQMFHYQVKIERMTKQDFDCNRNRNKCGNIVSEMYTAEGKKISLRRYFFKRLVILPFPAWDAID